MKDKEFAGQTFCSIRPERVKKYYIRYGKFKIEESYYTAEEANVDLAKLNASLRMLKRVLKHLDAVNYSQPLNENDYDRVCDEKVKLWDKADEFLCYVPTKAAKEFTDLSPRQQSNVTVGQAITLFIKMREGQEPIKSKEMSRYTIWITSAIGRMKPRNVKPDHIKTALQKLQNERNWSPQTRNLARASLSCVWTFIVQTLEADTRNTPSLVKKKPVPKNHTKPYTDEEVKKVIEIAYQLDRDSIKIKANCFKQNGPIVELFSLTGIRNQFLAGLRWEDIDFDHKQPNIYKFMKGVWRRIPLRRRAVTILKNLKKKSTSEWVFPSPVKGGEHGYANRWDERFKALLKKSDEVRYLEKPIHGFRSYVACELALAGMSALIIANFLGVTPRIAQGYIDEAGIQLADMAVAFLDGDTDEVPQIGGNQAPPSATQSPDHQHVH